MTAQSSSQPNSYVPFFNFFFSRRWSSDRHYCLWAQRGLIRNRLFSSILSSRVPPDASIVLVHVVCWIVRSTFACSRFPVPRRINESIDQPIRNARNQYKFPIWYVRIFNEMWQHCLSKRCCLSGQTTINLIVYCANSQTPKDGYNMSVVMCLGKLHRLIRQHV